MKNNLKVGHCLFGFGKINKSLMLISTLSEVLHYWVCVLEVADILLFLLLGSLLQERQGGSSFVQALLQQRRLSELHQRVWNQAASRGPQVRRRFARIRPSCHCGHTSQFLLLLWARVLGVQMHLLGASVFQRQSAASVALQLIIFRGTIKSKLILVK